MCVGRTREGHCHSHFFFIHVLVSATMANFYDAHACKKYLNVNNLSLKFQRRAAEFAVHSSNTPTQFMTEIINGHWRQYIPKLRAKKV